VDLQLGTKTSDESFLDLFLPKESTDFNPILRVL
jgi:hypothetical protein